MINIFSERNSLPVPSGVCLELGCSVGRVTLHLAKMFEKVVGLDVSSGNLKIASNNIQKSAIVNVDLIKLSTIEDFDKIPNFDFLYSIIVLQHNPPPIQKMILDKLFAKMNAGGGCLFQIPTELPNYRFDAKSYLSSAPPVMEMHALPMHVIFDLLRKHNISLKEVRPDPLTGLYGSFTFYAYGKEG